MKRFHFIAMIALGAFVSACCGGKAAIDKAFDKVTQTVDKAETNKANMTAGDWDAFAKEFETSMEELGTALGKSGKISDENQSRVMEITMRAANLMTEASMLQTQDDDISTAEGDEIITEEIVEEKAAE